MLHEEKADRLPRVRARMGAVYDYVVTYPGQPTTFIADDAGWILGVPASVIRSDLQRLWEDGQLVRYKRGGSWRWVTPEHENDGRRADEVPVLRGRSPGGLPAGVGDVHGGLSGPV